MRIQDPARKRVIDRTREHRPKSRHGDEVDLLGTQRVSHGLGEACAIK